MCQNCSISFLVDPGGAKKKFENLGHPQYNYDMQSTPLHPSPKKYTYTTPLCVHVFLLLFELLCNSALTGNFLAELGKAVGWKWFYGVLSMS